MHNSFNTPSHSKYPPYHFYFPDNSNIVLQRKKPTFPQHTNENLDISLQLLKADPMISEIQKRVHKPQSSIADGIEQNQFITSFEQKQKNGQNRPQCRPFDVFHERSQNNSRPSQKAINTDGQNLLDSQTYKEICFEENEKKTELVSILEVSSSSRVQNLCQTHQKPNQIVCIEDRCLICSHCAIFGSHKAHSLAPLKQIEQHISSKKIEINQIIASYKNLQLGTREKDFIGQFTEKITQKKNQTKHILEFSFKLIRQFLSNYQIQISHELEKFYQALQTQISRSVKRISLDSNRAAFEQWQRDASVIVQQISLQQLPKSSRVSLFLNNFMIPESMANNEEMISLEAQGNKYLHEIKEQLNLNIENAIKIAEKFKVNLNNQYTSKIKEFINFECEVHIDDLIEQNHLTTIESRLQANASLDFSHTQFNQTSSSMRMSMKQPKLSSTFGSMNQTARLSFVPKDNKLSSPVRKTQTNKKQAGTTQLLSGPGKKPIKFQRRQTEGTQRISHRITQKENIFRDGCPLNLLEYKCVRDEENSGKRVTSPNFNKIVKVKNQNLLDNPSNSTLSRCKSRDSVEVYSIFNSKTQPENKDINTKPEPYEIQEPLKILENFEKTETETFDLSNCNLNDTQILYFIQKAAKIRKIRHLKLTSNMLTSSGLEKILPYLSGCNLMNLSSNKLCEKSLDILLRRQERIPQLKMLNLSSNKLNERKIRQKIAQFKRMSIVMTL